MIFNLPPARESSSGSTPRANSPASAGVFYSCLANPFEFESQAKATEGKAGMAEDHDVLVRQSTAGTGLRVGVASAVLPATSEVMDVTAGETATNSSSISHLDELTLHMSQAAFVQRWTVKLADCGAPHADDLR